MSSAAKVGAFMIVILGVLGFFTLKIEDVKIGRSGKTRKVTAVFTSVAGLDNKSTVRVAGVRVGRVTDIRLRDDGKAEVTMEIDKDTPLRTNAVARVANLGLLGEKYIELDPGTPNQPMLSEEQQPVIPGGQVPSIDDVTSQISSIATDVKAITSSMRNVIGGPTGQQKLEAIVDNVQQITAQVRELIAANRSNVDATMANAKAISAQLRVEIPRLAESIEKVANSMNGTVGENREDVRHIVENLRGLSADLRVTADNVNSITGQVRSGKGTVGELIYSDETGKRLNTTLASIESGVNELKNTLGRVGKMQLDLGIGSDYYAGLPKSQGGIENIGGSSRAAVMMRLTPNPDRNRFYNIELADDPRGRQRDNVYEVTTTDASTGLTSTTITHETSFDRNFLVSAQAGWHFGPYDARLGLIDSTGGGGVDYRYSDRLRFTGEAFDFGARYDPNPHLRMYGEYTLRHEHPNAPQLFFRSGIDNPLNHRAIIFGAGVRWRDDDLKYLLGSVPIPK